jgi:uncharacterized protein (TIGR04442 family)
MKYQEVRLHGQVNDSIEYYVTVASGEAYRSYFYETLGNTLRIFSPGNELILDAEGLSHRGNGGSFCEYMFGVEQPLPDLIKEEVRNRLVMFGASSRNDGSLLFSKRTDGYEEYDRIFLEGNAVHNYFFFIFGSVSGPLHEQQEEILRLAGKDLKRCPFVGEGDDGQLVDELMSLLGHRSALYLIKLIHTKHQRYHDAFRDLYHTYQNIPDPEFARLVELADTLKIDSYQQERIRIDVMYKHAANRRIVDEYKNILVGCKLQGKIGAAENARLTRLKTLSVRSKIPSALFYALDEVLKPELLASADEQDYLSNTRQILEGIFLHERQIDARIDGQDLVQLLKAKRRAVENRDYAFEQMLLEAAKACDEKVRDGADVFLVENFSLIITYFDRFDSTSEHINQLAFMDKVRFSEELLRSLLNNKKEFDVLGPELFDNLFFSGIMQNRYLGQFGRRKILALRKGLTAIEEGRLTLHGLQHILNDICRQEEMFNKLLMHTKERIRNFYSRYSTAQEQKLLLAEVVRETGINGTIDDELLHKLFRRVVHHVQMEELYLHNLLPRIIDERNSALRSDFLGNSGLDRFYVEELEREYFEYNGLDMEMLLQLRQD